MSLVSLTFGNKRQSFSTDLISISTPVDNLKINPDEANTVKVKKVCQFLGDKNIYMVCEVVSGVICEQMVGNYEGNAVRILELDSKYPTKIAGKGMHAGLTVTGIRKCDVNKGDEINFALAQ